MINNIIKTVLLSFLILLTSLNNIAYSVDYSFIQDVILEQPIKDDFQEERKPFYIKSHNLNLIGVIHTPKSIDTKIKYPLVVLFHGYRGSKLGSNGYQTDIAKHLVRLGFIVVRCDLMGCGDSEGNPNNITLSIIERNTEDIINYVSQLPFIDKYNIGCIGFSLGGHSAIHAAKAFPKRVKTIVLWAPVANGVLWIQEMKKSFETRNSLMLSEHKLPGEEWFLLKDMIYEFMSMDDSLTVRFLPEHISMLHLHGIDDVCNSINHQGLFYKECFNGNRETEFVSYENCGHDLPRFENYQEVIKKIINWIDNQLKTRTP